MNYSFFFYKNFLSLLLFFQTICHTDIDKYSYIDFIEKISFVRYYFYRLFTGSCNNSSGNSFIFISLFVQSVWKSSNFNKRRNIADLYNGVTGHVCILLVQYFEILINGYSMNVDAICLCISSLSFSFSSLSVKATQFRKI